jgi:hypothetical protein
LNPPRHTGKLYVPREAPLAAGSHDRYSKAAGPNWIDTGVEMKQTITKSEISHPFICLLQRVRIAVTKCPIADTCAET